jgi:putative ABC transport system permease protein
VLKVALRGLLVHKVRLLLTFAAVAFGVAFVGGVLVLTDTMNRAFDDLFADIFRDTDAVVRSDETIDSDWGEMRALFDAGVLDEVRAADGVAAADGSVGGYARMIDQDGEPIGDPLMGAPTIGGNWTDVDALNPFDLTDGRAPAGAGEIVIDRGTAKDTGFEVGDTVTVQTRDLADDYEVVGIARFGTTDSPGGATYVMWTLDEAQRLLAEEGRYGAISVVGEDGVSQDDLAASIAGTLEASGTGGVEVLTGEAITEETQNDIKEQLGFLTQFFLVFAVIAVFVGTFVIYNSFSIIVAQRTREMALLRAIGARRRQVRRAVVVEAIVIGLAGSVLGFLAGLGLASLLGSLLQLPPGALAVLPTAVITAILTGLIVTVVSALVPAWRASRVPPLAAMRDVAIDTAGRSRLRIVVGLLVLVAGGAALVSGALDGEVPVVGLGAGLLFLGLLLVSPGLARPVSRLVGAPLARLRGVAGTLARENAGRNPKRTSATAQALMIGVGLVAFITIFADSAKASFSATIDRAFTGDFVLTHPGGVDPSVTAQLNELPEVEVASAIRFGAASIDGEVTQLLAADPATIFDLFDVEPVAGSPAELAAAGPAGLAVHEDAADRHGLRVGDRVPVVFRETGEQELVVAMIYGENQPAGSWLLGLEAYEANFAEQYDLQVFVRHDGSTAAPTALAAVEEVAATYPGVKVLDQTEYKAEQMAFVDQMLGLVYALLGLAIVIAIMGIGNTLALSILERTREVGVLRAVGMTRSQLRTTIRWESVIIALQGTVLGLAIGAFFSWAMVRALSDEGLGVLSLPVTNLVVVVALAALAGVVAAVLPARRAARMNILHAITTE